MRAAPGRRRRPPRRVALIVLLLARVAEEAVEEVVGRAAASAPKKSVMSCDFCGISVVMFTTIGDCALAMLRKVSARSSAPVIGALFIGGIAIVCADEAGVRSSRDAITMPTASEATAISTA